MSDVEKTPKAGGKGWSDAEKLGILFQIIARAGPIPWGEIELPAGRTLKAVQIMVDREKQKVRKAKEVEGENTADTPLTPTPMPSRGKKRNAKAAEVDDETATPTAKKVKAPRKTKATKAMVHADNSGAEVENSEDDLKGVKTEAYDEI